MKHLPLIFSSLSLAGVIALFALTMKPTEVSQPEEDLQVAVDSLASEKLSFPVAYVEIDTILQKYKFVQKIRKQLESQYKSAEAKFQSKMQAHQAKAQEFQKDYAMVLKMQQNGGMTEEQLMQQQQSLQARQQSILQNEQKIAQLQQKLQVQLAENQNKLNQEMEKNIQGFLDKYSQELNYSYVLVKGPGSSVWFGNDSLDITAKLVDFLNAEYEAGLEKK